MNVKRINKTLIELCEIPSPSKNEREVADYILNRTSKLGVDVIEDNAGKDLGGNTGNLIIKLGKGTSPLLLSAHMDTVMANIDLPNKINVAVSNEVVHTDGTTVLGADDKAGIAIAIEIMHYAVENKDTLVPLEIVFTVQEEIGVLGANYLNKSQLNSKHGFVLDGDTDVGTAIVQSPYKWKYFLNVVGKSAHAAIDPENGINAIRALGSIINVLPYGKIDENTVTNYGIVKGGSATNVVPDQASLIGELRGHDLNTIQNIQKNIQEDVDEIVKEHGASFDLSWTSLYPGYSVSLEDLCMYYFVSACNRLDIEPQYVVTDGGGDANHLNGAGISCVPFGLGMKAIHTNQEYIKLSDLHLAFNLLLECLQCGYSV